MMQATSQGVEPPLAPLARIARAAYTSQGLWHHAAMRPAPSQRARMIERFHNRKMASDPRSLEHHLCACIVLALLYGGSVRTINRVARDTRAKWRTSTCENS